MPNWAVFSYRSHSSSFLLMLTFIFKTWKSRYLDLMLDVLINDASGSITKSLETMGSERLT